jgi:uncharacterized protein YegP (UPF0339 family)
MRPKQKKTGKLLKKIKSKKSTWEVYSYKEKGKNYFGNRLVRQNGYIILENNGFQTMQSAIHNINVITKSI